MSDTGFLDISGDQAIRFVSEVLNPLFVESTEFPIEAWRKLGEFGLFGIAVKEEHGGLGHSCVESCELLQAFGYAMHDQGLLHAACTQILCAIAVDRFGTQAQKDMYLPGICSGSLIFAQAITEPGAGSDLAMISTTGIENERGFVLRGSKVFISNAPVADAILVFCVTDPERRSFGRLSCLLLDGKESGLRKGQPMDKMGLHSLQNGELFFDDCVVPSQNLLGKRGGGDAIFGEIMTWERTLLFATMVGKQQAVIEACVEYSNSRVQGGQPISKHQAISHNIANMKMNQYLSGLAVVNAARVKDSGKSAVLESSLCKLFVSESLKSSCLAAVQIRGAYGYMKEFGAERDLRDAMAATIYSGTSEIQRNIIARLIGL